MHFQGRKRPGWRFYHARWLEATAPPRYGAAMPSPTSAAKRRTVGIFVGDECPQCHQEIQPREPTFVSVSELLDRMRSSPEPGRDQIAGLLTAAVSILHQGKSGWERACWRVADALLLLGKKFPDASGIKTRTGRGAKLSRSPRR